MGPVLALYRPALMETCAKYSTAADVWMRLVHGITKPKSARMDRGLRVEPMLRDLYRETVGPVSDAPGLLVHPSQPWGAASPDGFAGDDGVVEYKSTSVFSRAAWGEPGTDEVPDAYSVQVQWQLEVTGRQWAHLLVAFGRDFTDEATGLPDFAVEEHAIYQMERDAELCAALVECGARFWREHIDTGMPPPVEPKENRREWARLRKSFSQHNGSTKEAAP